MSGSLSVDVTRQGRAARLADVTCTLGRRDKPYPEIHDPTAWTIALVRRGTFRYRAAATNRSHTLRAGWLLLGRPGATFECSHENDGGDVCASLTVTPDVWDEVSAAASVSSKRLLAAPPALPPVPRVAALIERARARDGHGVDELGYLVAETAVASACDAPLVQVAPHPSHVGRVHEAMELLEGSCRAPLCLAEVSNAIGFSPFHFLRVFRRVTGTTPHQYLVGARLRLAVQLLLETDRPVTEIAYDVGFQDLSNFVRTFHRVVGCSPRAYRRDGVGRTAPAGRRRS